MSLAGAGALVEATAFLYREARLLDDGRFEEWLDLFTPDGTYWIPSRHGQTDPRGVASIIYEDRSILALRVQRLAEARAHAMSPMPRTTHLIGNVELVEAKADAATIDCTLIVVEHRNERQRIYSGRCRYALRAMDGDLRIASKRIDLVDCDAILAPIVILL
jgi:3-phenylpropionate/cinnamic acid dioxygenase small subunit